MNTALHRDLARILGEDGVASDTETLVRFGGDALGAYRAFRATSQLDSRAAAVAWPTDSGQVTGLLRYANSNRIPVVPYGAGTGVMGAAVSADGAIVLNLQRMNNILDVSAGDFTARTQPGVILEDAHAAMKSEGLRLGHDPWSRPIATVGGAISTDGVGYTAAAHGPMGDQVLGLEVVLADGETIRTRAVPKSSYGPSLERLFIGSEGTLGVITEATIKAFRRPESRVMRSFVFPEFEAGFEAIVAMQAEGVSPAVMDYGDEPAGGGAPEATLYVSFEGFAAHVETHVAQAESVCTRHDGRDGEPGEVEQYWRTRHSSAERYREEVLNSPDPAARRLRRSSYRMDYLHMALPISQVLEYRRRCALILEERDIGVREWSVWGRPEFFSMLIVDERGSDAPESRNMEQTIDAVLTLAQDMGGTMEYCHGIGLKLAHLTPAELGSGYKPARDIKAALDPNGILNPGKLLG
ncbi:MAG: FAD-binding oxidoreductase [SAR202 cluster bacterium]|jgi:FAD/FMN-containing dehydrogenase|nr:FAD-binding oxidoreductase [SAR202 cluster bacterium]MDP6665334.1 FAD-binding oxidoreductase [SAR202 cluster bacterium]MDP6799613.1 FAD-binding oxidoreductase [SAR202 cluster bacterium]|tara:strand:+ start:12103 stop:13506 length:1404 start_codon:yes stop_codon:yes gene_type:complete